MLRGVILSLLFSQAVEGRRIANVQKHDVHRREPDNAENVTDWKCQAECGAEIVQVGGKDFAIGVDGNKKPSVHARKDSECMSECFVGRKGNSCGFGYEKVAKIKGNDKLCCKVQHCTWRVDLEDGLKGYWEQQQPGETERLFPLQTYEAGEVTRNSCFCCSQPGIPWNGNVNLKCKLAYGNTGNIWMGVGAALTLSLSDQVWKQGCEYYCRYFKGYEHAKKSFRFKKWVPPVKGQEEIPVDGPATAKQLGKELQPKVAAGKAELAKIASLKDDGDDEDLDKMLLIGEEIQEVMQLAEDVEVAPHMDAGLLQDAKDTLMLLDEKTLPLKLASVVGDFAAEAHTLNADVPEQKKKLLKFFEELEAAVMRASDFVKATGKEIDELEAARVTLDHLALMVDKGVVVA